MEEIEIYLELIKRSTITHIYIDSKKIMGDGLKILD